VSVERAHMAMETSASSSWIPNVITVIAFIANTVVTYLSQTGIFGYTNSELSRKYQTLVTPIGYAFAIWGPIFILEGAFTVAQCVPRLHASPDVRGVGFWFAGVCVAQVGWTLAFSNDVVWLSLLLMLCIWVLLASTLYSHLCAVDKEPPAAWRFALFRLPFLLHFGWITAASFVNINVVLVAYGGGKHTLLLGAAIVSLALLLLLGVYNPATSTAFGADPVYTLVIAWALFGVGNELKTPEDSLTAWCPPLVIDALSGVSTMLAAVLVAYAAAMAAVRLAARYQTKEADAADALRLNMK